MYLRLDLLQSLPLQHIPPSAFHTRSILLLYSSHAVLRHPADVHSDTATASKETKHHQFHRYSIPMTAVIRRNASKRGVDTYVIGRRQGGIWNVHTFNFILYHKTQLITEKDEGGKAAEEEGERAGWI